MCQRDNVKQADVALAAFDASPRYLIATCSPVQISCTIQLLVSATGVLTVITAATAAQGETNMSELNTETTEAAATAPVTGKKKARPGARKPRVAKPGAKATRKATPAKKTPKTAPKATPKPKAARPGKAGKEKGVREGTKTDAILALMKRAGGVTLKQLRNATGWQPHSVRGFISGTLRKKMGLTVVSTRSENGERTYSINASAPPILFPPSRRIQTPAALFV